MRACCDFLLATAYMLAIHPFVEYCEERLSMQRTRPVFLNNARHGTMTRIVARLGAALCIFGLLEAGFRRYAA